MKSLTSQLGFSDCLQDIVVIRSTFRHRFCRIAASSILTPENVSVPHFVLIIFAIRALDFSALWKSRMMVKDDTYDCWTVAILNLFFGSFISAPCIFWFFWKTRMAFVITGLALLFDYSLLGSN